MLVISATHYSFSKKLSHVKRIFKCRMKFTMKVATHVLKISGKVSGKKALFLRKVNVFLIKEAWLPCVLLSLKKLS